MRSLCSNPPHPALKHFTQLTCAPFSQDSSARRGRAFRRTRPLRARRTSTTINNWGPRVAERLRRAVVASRMWWSDGAGGMKVASLALSPQRLAFWSAIEFLHGVWTVGGSVLSSQACSVCLLDGSNLCVVQCCVQDRGPVEPSHSSFVWWNAPTIRFGPVRAAVSLDFCMRDPSFFCLCPVFVVKPVVLMYKKVLRPFSTSSTETQVRGILGLRRGFCAPLLKKVRNFNKQRWCAPRRVPPRPTPSRATYRCRFFAPPSWAAAPQLGAFSHPTSHPTHPASDTPSSHPTSSCSSLFFSCT